MTFELRVCGMTQGHVAGWCADPLTYLLLLSASFNRHSCMIQLCIMHSFQVLVCCSCAAQSGGAGHIHADNECSSTAQCMIGRLYTQLNSH